MPRACRAASSTAATAAATRSVVDVDDHHIGAVIGERATRTPTPMLPPPPVTTAMRSAHSGPCHGALFVVCSAATSFPLLDRSVRTLIARGTAGSVSTPSRNRFGEVQMVGRIEGKVALDQRVGVGHRRSRHPTIRRPKARGCGSTTSTPTRLDALVTELRGDGVEVHGTVGDMSDSAFVTGWVDAANADVRPDRHPLQQRRHVAARTRR